MEITERAYAKINLTLDVLGKREDGYHNIISIMQSISLHDILTVKRTNKDINVNWNLSDTCDSGNTVYKAAQLMFREYSLDGGLLVFIEKKIPISAGLGGGSTDAAAVIKCINKLYNLKLSNKKLLELGASIGADVPFCLINGMAIAEGIGERLLTLNEKIRCYVVLVKPMLSISTKTAFSKIDKVVLSRRFDTNLATEAIKAADYKNLGQNLYNAMEIIAFPEYPIIHELKKKMIVQGAFGALMSGSGPTVYGIFENKILAENAYNSFKNLYKGNLPVETFLCEFYYPHR